MPSVEKIDAGVSVKMNRDLYAKLRALEKAFGRGINAVIQELLRRENERAVAAIMAAQRLERFEELLVRLLQKFDDDDAASSTPPTYKAE